MKTFTVENTFHSTTATIKLPDEGRKLTRDEVDRIVSDLCGMDDCSCEKVVPGDRQDCVWDQLPGSRTVHIRPLS